MDGVAAQFAVRISSSAVQTLTEDLQLSREWLVVCAGRACSPLLVPPPLQVLDLLRCHPWCGPHGQSMPQPTSPAGAARGPPMCSFGNRCLQDWHMYFRRIHAGSSPPAMPPPAGSSCYVVWYESLTPLTSSWLLLHQDPVHAGVVVVQLGDARHSVQGSCL